MSDTPHTLDLTATEAAPEIVLSENELAMPAARPGELVLPEDEQDDELGLPKDAVRLADGRIRLPLKYPRSLIVRIGAAAGKSETYDALTMRRLNGLDRKEAQSKPEDQMTMVLAARSAGMRLDLFNALWEQMDAEDVVRVERVIGHFLGLGRRTGR
ncbi:phage tail assembly protein [Roseomonas sp. HJA6]|uniref:Phage tail assembly protein n=1 Tax=Roseomonas alba TaxID=2846776 RepID=A0ABS7AIA3_9PROT|nr:phage tail assembly protein [Neoroseomonas alba]MBW6402031.1 phage tail assembly protein [Neoroseomonas alba]